MMTLRLFSPESGETLDVMHLSSDGVTYQTGRSRSIVEAHMRRERCTEAYACAALDGWSNGYRRIEVSDG